MGAYEVGATGGAIIYLYDLLYRLTSATYSTGNAFSYTYDAVGNTLTRTQTLAGQLVTTTYTYNAANALVTAKDNTDPTTWYYTYDPNGRLTDITPNGTAPANGARRFTYSVAGYLIQTETYTGTAYQLQAQMQYTGGLFYCASRLLPYPSPVLNPSPSPRFIQEAADGRGQRFDCGIRAFYTPRVVGFPIFTEKEPGL